MTVNQTIRKCVDGMADISRLAAITCHFNFARYKQPIKNLKAFIAYMAECKVPLWGVEVHFADQKPVTKGLPNWKQIIVDDRHVMWQKEALLNLAERMVPASYDQIVWLDADVHFQQADWPQRTAKALEQRKLVQPYEMSFRWGRNNEIIRKKPSFIRSSKIGKQGHAGFALAARREMWQACGGLYSRAILGGGDSAVAAAALGLAPLPMVKGWNGKGVGLSVPETYNYYAVWQRKFIQWLQGSVAYIPGGIHHAWHGDIEHRLYRDRWKWMTDFNAKREVWLNADGVLEWTAKADVQRMAAIKAYFANRREDG